MRTTSFVTALVIGLSVLISFKWTSAFAAQQPVNITGRWLANDVPNAPWTLDFKQDGTALGGTVQQNGALRGPASIYDGTVNGTTISFKAKSPDDGARTITFTGTVNGATMTLNRSAEATPGAGIGAGMNGRGLFGGSGTGPFTASREGTGAATAAAAAPRWIARTGVAYAPWTFDLKIENGIVSGTAAQGPADTASGFTTTLVGPFAIYDGRSDGNTITFKVKTPDGGRIVTFSGIRNGNQIAFTRTVQVIGGDPGRDGILDASGAAQLVAVLDDGRPAPPPASVASAPPVIATGPAGRWQVMEVPNAPWTFEFGVSGNSLTGTVRQNPGDAVSIAAGKIDGTLISFKVLAPDGERLITFRGRVNGNEISFVRQIDVLRGGGRGGNDLYGASAALQFVARRAR